MNSTLGVQTAESPSLLSPLGNSHTFGAACPKGA